MLERRGINCALLKALSRHITRDNHRPDNLNHERDTLRPERDNRKPQRDNHRLQGDNFSSCIMTQYGVCMYCKDHSSRSDAAISK